jgi:hypothetical protein
MMEVKIYGRGGGLYKELPLAEILTLVQQFPRWLYWLVQCIVPEVVLIVLSFRPWFPRYSPRQLSLVGSVSCPVPLAIASPLVG